MPRRWARSPADCPPRTRRKTRATAATAETEEKRVKRKLTISKELTPLQVKLTNLADLISNVGYIAAMLIFLALLGAVCTRTRCAGIPNVRSAAHVTDPQRRMETTGQALLASSKALLNYFVYMVIIIVVAVPEGLPMSVTVSLALAMQKMTRANSLVRQLVACETIGSATVICSDKTGTLTQNKMQVVRLFWDGQIHDRGSPQWLPPGPMSPHLAGRRASRSTGSSSTPPSTRRPISKRKQGKLVTVGNSTEGALLHWLHEAGLEYQKLRLQFAPLYQIHFSSERKRMTTVVQLRRPAGGAGQGRAGVGVGAQHALPDGRWHAREPGRPRRGRRCKRA